MSEWASLTFFSVVMYRCSRLESNSRFLLTLSPETLPAARPYTSGWADKCTFSTCRNTESALTHPKPTPNPLFQNNITECRLKPQAREDGLPCESTVMKRDLSMKVKLLTERSSYGCQLWAVTGWTGSRIQAVEAASSGGHLGSPLQI